MNKSIDLEESLKDNHLWIVEISNKVGRPSNPEYGYKILKGVLHAIRDKLLLHEVFYFSSHLPLFIRGIYFDGYNPRDLPVLMYNNELLKRFAERMGPRNSSYFEEYLQKSLSEKIDGDELLQQIEKTIELNNEIKPEVALRAVLEVLYDRLSEGEINGIQHLIHHDVQHLLHETTL